MNTLSVYDSLELKIKKGVFDLTQDERNKLEDLLIDRYTERVTRVDDETLMGMASDEKIF